MQAAGASVYNIGNEMVGAAMTGRIGDRLAILAVLSILAIFLFPAVQGPYSAVHGPATAMLAAQAALRLRIAMVRAAMSLLGGGAGLGSPLVVLLWPLFSAGKFERLLPLETSTLLRC
jgi:hypothetical protein